MEKVTSGFWAVIVCLLPLQFAVADSCPGQIRGGWETELPVSALFKITLELERLADGEFTARLVSGGVAEDIDVWRDAGSLRLQSGRSAIAFEGRLSSDGQTIDGFVDFASSLYRISLAAKHSNLWSGEWSPVPLVADSVYFDLYFDDDGAGGTGGYFFFRDDRMPSLYGLGVRCLSTGIEVREKNLGLSLVGEFDDDFSEFRVTVSAPGRDSSIVFTPMSRERQVMIPGTSALPPRISGASTYAGRAPEETGDGWRTAAPSDTGVNIEPLIKMVADVVRGELPKTHSILVARSGRLIVEEYFYGFDRDMIHDMRSASKSLASTLAGLAVDRGLIEGADARVLPFFTGYRSYRSWDPRKAVISLRHLMTMSSGLDADDSDPDSVAAEGAYQSQSARSDWIKLALDAPMIADPGTRLIYGGANPLVLGGVLAKVVGNSVEWFADEALFRPLGIDTYRIAMDPMGIPYMGGGMHLRPRDMLKIGQMYLDHGRWQGRQILSRPWVEESFGSYGRLEPLDRNGNEYGYLWWHEHYVINGRRIDSVEARGNGGQYIFIVPELKVAAVMTSGNYRGGLTMTRQPQRIFERYVLPALVRQ